MGARISRFLSGEISLEEFNSYRNAIDPETR